MNSATKSKRWRMEIGLDEAVEVDAGAHPAGVEHATQC
jgi:hypothetical protein